MIGYLGGAVVVSGLALLITGSGESAESAASERRKAFFQAGALVLLVSLAGWAGWGLQSIIDGMQESERIRDRLLSAGSADYDLASCEAIQDDPNAAAADLAAACP